MESIETPKTKEDVTIHQENLLREGIENIPMDDSLKYDFILSWYGFKPATEISLRDEGACTLFEDLCKKLGFKFIKMSPNMIKRSPSHDVSIGLPAYIVAKRDQDLETLRELLNRSEGSPLDDYHAFGSVYGFPKTAVDAFRDIDKRIRWRQELPIEVQEGELLPFAQFALSAEHWKEELEEVSKWAGAIKRISPALYERIISDFRKSILESKK